MSAKIQIALVERYRQAMHEHKIRMIPPQDKITFGSAYLGWRYQLKPKGYAEPKVELPDFVYHLSLLAIRACNNSFPLPDKNKSTGFIQHYNCYQDANTSSELSFDANEDADLLESGSPVTAFYLGCAASYFYKSNNEIHQIAIESGDCIVFGKSARLFERGIAQVLPDTEPSCLKNLLPKPLLGLTSLTVRQVKA